jgi:aldehyde dehydrogenase (NAD+)
MDEQAAKLKAMREFFDAGATRSYSYRRLQLQRLKQALIQHESEILQALYHDLKKNPEVVHATETGLLLAEINVALKNLKKWMRPTRAATNLMNLPGSSKIYHDPLGVIFIIAPWNYPFQLSLIPLVGAIAGGNCAVVKPSELAPATAIIIEKIIRENFPSHYISIVQGEGSAVVPSIMKSFRFDHVFYTGSVPVGKSIYQQAAADLIPVTLELGGKNPAIVEEDANLTIAAKRIVLGKFINAGQICVAPDYVLVNENIKDKLIEELKQAILNFYGETPAESEEYGKIINEIRFDKILTYLEEPELVFGGQHDRSRLFIAPSIIKNPSLDSSLMNEEIFGPVLPVLGFSSAQEAKSIIGRNPNPLSLYVFTSSAEKEKFWIEQIPFGGGCVNNTAWQFTNHNLPFGGIGESGIGAYHGKHSFEIFTHAKPVMKTPSWIDPSLKYPPFSGKMKWFRRLIR